MHFIFWNFVNMVINVVVWRWFYVGHLLDVHVTYIGI